MRTITSGNLTYSFRLIWGGKMIDKNSEIMLEKIKYMQENYEGFLYNTLSELEVEYIKPEERSFNLPSDNATWQKAEHGMIWGDGTGYAWFRSNFSVAEELEGKTLWIISNANAAESLVFINQKPIGLLDYAPDFWKKEIRLHRAQQITQKAKKGEKLSLLLECFGGNSVLSGRPLTEGFEGEFYPTDRNRKFEGIYIAERNEVVHEFLLKLNLVLQLVENMDSQQAIKWKAFNALKEVFANVTQNPKGMPQEEWQKELIKANEIMTAVLTDGETTKATGKFYGFIGHSHLDTAWRWTVEETHHKAARTFSNVLSLLERYDDYIFMQSSAIYVDWMKKYYPDIYEGIVKYTKEGRWEPNGGSWVECDGNMTGGEYLIRQFLIGQRYLKENLDYTGDCFWQPDTFGYSPAIPQIMLSCGMKYFLTTKFAWNEYNTFPNDTFIWRGIDGSEVLTHFNLIHVWPDVKTVRTAPIMNPEKANAKLIAYGFGDGGGGPVPDMIETAKIVEDMPYMPECKHTTVSNFMKRLEKESKDLNVYDGELYLELHRGTLTQMHDIKRSNRKAEIAIHNAEAVNVHSNLALAKPYNQEIGDMLRVLLTNQFHDILPGSSLQEVHELAIEQNYGIVEKTAEIAKDLLTENNEATVSLYNTLGFNRADNIVLDGECAFKGFECQSYTDINGNQKTVVAGVEIPALAAVTLEKSNETQKGSSRFLLSGNSLETPFYKVKFTDNGEIETLTDLRANREIATEQQPLNSLVWGEDIPYWWDNWDINYDQKLKMTNVAKLENTEIVTNGAIELRIRRTYSLAQSTKLVQDTVFYANNPRIDFETELDWQDKHTLLKAVFPVNIHTHFARFETQFGFIERANNENNCYELVKFEVCNHKWTDLSESRYGVAMLNDCKYGISVDNNVMALTLHRGGCSPDPNGDVGVHRFTYSILPHNSGFSVDSVIREAYFLNYEPVKFSGTTSLTESMLKLDSETAIIETVKPAEEKDGYIVRIYESEGNTSDFCLKTNFAFSRVCETNMLEEPINELTAKDSAVSGKIKPFEIKTIKFYVR